MSPARWWQGTLWLGSEFHCLPLQGTGGCIGKGQLLRSQADRAGYENPGEDCGRPHQTVGVNRRFPVWLRPRQRQYRCNLCCQAAAREVSTCQQETLHGFRRPGEGIWSSTLEGHLVGAEKSWCGGVDCATGAGDVCKCAESCPCWWGVQWRVWSEGWCSPRISSLLFIIVLEALSWELRSGVPWEDLYADDLVIITESLEECVRRLLTWKEAMEKKGLRVNAGKTKIMICGTGLDLLQSSGDFHASSVALEWAASSAMAASTGCTRNAVGSSAWKKTLTTDVHGARELHAPWMADHRRKCRWDLTSLRW